MAGDVLLKIDAESAKAVQAFVKLENKQDALERKAKSLHEKTRAMNSQSKKGTDDWIKSTESLLLKYASIGAAIGVATKAVREHHAEMERGAQRINESSNYKGALAQLAGGDALKYKKMIEDSRKSILQEGMTEQEAYKLQFALESMGKQKDRELFASLYDIRGNKDLGAFVEGVSTVQNAMGEKETGDSAAVAAKMLTASAVSKTDITEFAPAVSIAAKTAGMIGASDEEVMSSVAHLSKSTKSADQAGTQISAFSQSLLDKKGFENLGLIGAAKKVQAMNMNNAQMMKFFGSSEALKGYQGTIGQLGDIENTVQDLNDVQKNSREYLKKQVAVRDSDDEDVSARVNRKSQALVAEEERRRGVEGNNQQSARNVVWAKTGEAGQNILRRLVTDQILNFAMTVGKENWQKLQTPLIKYNPITAGFASTASYLEQVSDPEQLMNDFGLTGKRDTIPVRGGEVEVTYTYKEKINKQASRNVGK